ICAPCAKYASGMTRGHHAVPNPDVLRLFSSRRRHTRFDCDWSSDACSSDRSEEHTSELQSQSNLVCRLIRSEEHTSELQSQSNLVCRLLLEKKKSNMNR